MGEGGSNTDMYACGVVELRYACVAPTLANTGDEPPSRIEPNIDQKCEEGSKEREY